MEVRSVSRLAVDVVEAMKTAIVGKDELLEKVGAARVRPQRIVEDVLEQVPVPVPGPALDWPDGVAGGQVHAAG